MRKCFYLILAVLCTAGCIRNDLSYPRIVAEITSFEVEGQKSVTIDASTRTVSVVLEETADINGLIIKSFAYTKEAELITPLPAILDLSKPLILDFRTYQDYQWTIVAEQPIERFIEVENQVGSAEIDIVNHMAYVYVTEDQELKSITFNDIKLEAEGSVVMYTVGQVSVGGTATQMKEDCLFPLTVDCVVMRSFYVEHKGDTIKWNVKVMNKAVDLEVSSVSAWCYSADVKAVSKGGASSVVEYKTSSASSWTVAEDLTVKGTSVTAHLSRLKAGTNYVVRISNGGQVSDEFSFKTGSPVQLDNMDFDDWSMPDGKTWYPFLESQSNPAWGTANPGTSIMGANTTRPEYGHVVTPGGAAARIESLVVAVFAAGNLFTGRFAEFSDMTAKINWGTPFTSRPYSLKGYYDYSPKTIDKAPDTVPFAGIDNPYKDQMGKADHCQIMVALVADGDTEEDKGPFLVSSKIPGQPDLKNNPRVIAYGALESDVATDGYQEFECVLEYKDDRTPAYVIVVACSSLRGDYFTGGVGSVMYVDDFEFIYR